ncbi:MAG: hypothetical protein JSS09_08120, partial [Verrucomicrobia bacterium]|nr:hypothetical protein [Verrucomicrobiota bacterium]
MINRIASSLKTYGPRVFASGISFPVFQNSMKLQGNPSFFLNSQRTFSLLPKVPLSKQDYTKAVASGGIFSIFLAAGLALQDREKDGVEYGNKHADLVQVAEYLKQHPLEKVVVPLPKGLSHSCIHGLLTKKAPEVFLKWKKLEELFADCKDKNLFLEDPNVLESLTLIENKIVEIFDQLKPKELASLSHEEGLGDWLTTLQKRGSYLMVRSSGVEDNKGMPNAGGNLSEEYIDANLPSLFSSAGRVIASYFAVPSLRNQIEAGINPFSFPLSLSVMLQELIGEPPSGAKDPADIPISLVLFTTEPNDSEGDFHVTKICGSFGHGSGVVNYCGVNSDRIHLIRSQIKQDEILEAYQNKDKEFRLAPIKDAETQKVFLTLTPNPIELRKKRVLDAPMLKRLELLSKHLEKAFNGKPRDVEIVIKRGIIHIVQARDLSRPSEGVSSYLNLSQIEQLPKSPLLQKISTKVLVLGKSSAQVISDPSQILICDTLAQAERVVGSKNKSVVIVGLDEENTHPVVNFSSHGVTCLYVQNLNETKKLLLEVSASHPLIVCPQSGSIYLWDSSIAKPEMHIQEGYFSHPASLGFSLGEAEDELPFEPIQKGEVPKEIEEAIRALKAASSAESAKRALEELRSYTSNELIQAKHSYTVLTGKENSSVLGRMEKVMNRAFEELDQESAFLKQRLYHIKTLETLLGKQPPGSLYTYSILDAKQLSKEKDAILLYRNKLSKAATPHFEGFLFLKKLCFSLEGEKLFEDFFLSLENLPFTSDLFHKKEEFSSLIALLKQHGALELFINIGCLPNIDLSNPESSLDRILASFSREDIPFLQKLEEHHKSLSKLKISLELFENPKTFDKAWEELSKLVNFCGDDFFVASFIKSSSLGRLIEVKFLEELVETIDLSIKSMKKSS